MAFEAPFLEEKLRAKGIFSSHEEYVQAFTEFKRYVALGRLSGSPLAMMSKQVDEVWHQFILFTREYMRFCDRFLGYYLHHTPALNSAPVSQESVSNFADAYQKYFGPIPAVWGAVAKCHCTTCEGDRANRVASDCESKARATCDTGKCASCSGGGMMRASSGDGVQCVSDSSDSDGDSRSDPGDSR